MTDLPFGAACLRPGVAAPDRAKHRRQHAAAEQPEHRPARGRTIGERTRQLIETLLIQVGFPLCQPSRVPEHRGTHQTGPRLPDAKGGRIRQTT